MTARRPAKQPANEPRGQPVLRQTDQAMVAGLVVLALAGMTAYWFVQGGPRGQLIDIDRAAPLVARFQVDINQADWPELAQLPDVGAVLAQRIVDSRLKEGSFVDHDDLLRVNGIGPLTLEKIKPYLLPMPDQQDVARNVGQPFQADN
jgi:competence protein ComEA